VTIIDLFKCPFCGCTFVSDLDRQGHLDAFGREKSMHLERLRVVHEEIEEELGKVHGGADQAVFEMEREIKRERRRRLELMVDKVLRRGED
jgi:hypothetical protein